MYIYVFTGSEWFEKRKHGLAKTFPEAEIVKYPPEYEFTREEYDAIEKKSPCMRIFEIGAGEIVHRIDRKFLKACSMLQLRVLLNDRIFFGEVSIDQIMDSLTHEGLVKLHSLV